MEHKNPYAPLAMAGVAIPAYATPLVAMSQLGSMFQHANSVGAAFVLLTLGAGINLGLIAWVFRNYGFGAGPGLARDPAGRRPAPGLRDRESALPRARSSRRGTPTPSTSTAALSTPALSSLPQAGPRQAQGRPPPVRARRPDRPGLAGGDRPGPASGSTAAGASRIGWNGPRARGDAPPPGSTSRSRPRPWARSPWPGWSCSASWDVTPITRRRRRSSRR